MKNIKNIIFRSLMLVAVLGLLQCGVSVPKGQKIVDLPCFQDKYTSKKKEYIASGRGISADQVTARKKAMINAKSEIAALIKSNIRSLVDDYTISRTVNNQEEVKSRFESLTSESVEQMLVDVEVACQELTFDKKNKQYNSYLALKIDKDNLAASIADKLSQEEKKELDLDYGQFRELLDRDVPIKN
ncbi:MAG: hypothetical protein HQ474_05670 [Flammeovirgaceae bacterium]|jgi:hypothetical protein|nr:hypothetical protein [Flammeovirgaceae bacterium]